MMFDRLWRKDSARTGEHHIGLGLSLVKSYVEILRLGISVTLDLDNLFSISICGLKKQSDY